MAAAVAATPMRLYFSEDGRHVTFVRPDCLDAFVLVSVTPTPKAGASLSFLSRVFCVQFADTAARLRTAHRSGEAYLSVDGPLVAAGEDEDEGLVRIELAASPGAPPLLVGVTHVSCVRPEVWARFVDAVRSSPPG